MLLRHSLELEEEAQALEHAIHRTIANGVRTADIASDGGSIATTTEMTDAIIQQLR
jgi:3-isopropylmalate dehydrogenase